MVREDAWTRHPQSDKLIKLKIFFRLQRHGQIFTSPTRDNRGFITDLLNRRTDLMQTTLSDYSVGFAANLTLGSMTANIPGAPANFSGTNSYTHDAKLQLTQETSTRASGYTNNQGCDGRETRRPSRESTRLATPQTRTPPTPHDGAGNPTTYKGSTLAFDAENRMTSFGSILTAGYRADGMRAWKQNSSGTTYYFYDGDTLVMETDATGVKTAVNTNGPNGLLARTDATRTLLYAFDALGQLSQQVIAGAGTIAATYLFDAWGTRSFSSTDTAATSDPYSGYGSSSGYISDWETGLQLLGHRYYDPTIGRFLNRDPIGMAGGVNVYGYCSNNPNGNSDKSGLMSFGDMSFGEWWGETKNIFGDEGGGGKGSCLGGAVGAALIPLIQALGQGASQLGPGLLNALCKLLVGCGIGALATLIVAGIFAVTGGSSILLFGCLIGAISGFLSSILLPLCDGPCGWKPPNWKCAGEAAISGCVGGLFGSWGPTIGTALGDFIDTGCKNNFW